MYIIKARETANKKAVELMKAETLNEAKRLIQYCKMCKDYYSIYLVERG